MQNKPKKRYSLQANCYIPHIVNIQVMATNEFDAIKIASEKIRGNSHFSYKRDYKRKIKVETSVMEILKDG